MIAVIYSCTTSSKPYTSLLIKYNATMYCTDCTVHILYIDNNIGVVTFENIMQYLLKTSSDEIMSDEFILSHQSLGFT